MATEGVFNRLRKREEIFDEDFDALFPEEFRSHSYRHYTSVHIAQKAIEFLCEDPNATILDIGSGIGKFCLVGAATRPNRFIGVEYRPNFVRAALQCASEHSIENVEFICEDVRNIEFSGYTNFYMFNPFLEHRDPSARMDDHTTNANFEAFQTYVYSQFDQLPSGTRLVTYYVNQEQLPETFEFIGGLYGDTLKFWRKI